LGGRSHGKSIGERGLAWQRWFSSSQREKLVINAATS
jgi:hypothetical protein